jgi:hypothetical protein
MGADRQDREGARSGGVSGTGGFVRSDITRDGTMFLAAPSPQGGRERLIDDARKNCVNASDLPARCTLPPPASIFCPSNKHHCVQCLVCSWNEHACLKINRVSLAHLRCFAYPDEKLRIHKQLGKAGRLARHLILWVPAVPVECSSSRGDLQSSPPGQRRPGPSGEMNP